MNDFKICLYGLGICLLLWVIWAIMSGRLEKIEIEVDTLINKRQEQIYPYLNREKLANSFNELRDIYNQMLPYMNKLKRKYFFDLNKKAERKKRKKENQSYKIITNYETIGKKKRKGKYIVNSDEYTYEEHPEDFRVERSQIYGLNTFYWKLILVYPVFKAFIISWENLGDLHKLKIPLIIMFVIFVIISIIIGVFLESFGTILLGIILSIVLAFASVFGFALVITFIKISYNFILYFSITQELIKQICILIVWGETCIGLKFLHCSIIANGIISEAYIKRDELKNRVENFSENLEKIGYDNETLEGLIDNIKGNLLDIKEKAIQYCSTRAWKRDDKDTIKEKYNDYFFLGGILNHNSFRDNEIDIDAIRQMNNIINRHSNEGER